MADDAADSVMFYDRNAERFEADTGRADMSPLRNRFLRRLQPGARILDVGCGTGRDASVFAELGFKVVAIDASAEMVRLARKRLGARGEVCQVRFDEVAWLSEFDGIWACASLLHVPHTRFAETASLLASAMRPCGAFYMSFKYGVGERYADNRHFTDHTEETLSVALQGTGLRLREVWVSNDVRHARSKNLWLNAIANRDFTTIKVTSPRQNEPSHG